MQNDQDNREMSLFLSFWRRNHLSRGLVRVHMHDGSSRFLHSQEGVKVRTRLVNAKGARKVKRVVSLIVRGPADLPSMMSAVEKAVGNQGLLIAGQLIHENGKREQWISPKAKQLLEILKDLKETRRQLEVLRNNGAEGSEVRFFERSERIAQGNLLIDCGLSQIDEHRAELLKTEVENFQRGFSVEF